MNDPVMDKLLRRNKQLMDANRALEAARKLADDVLWLYEQRWDQDEEIAALKQPLDNFERALKP